MVYIVALHWPLLTCGVIYGWKKRKELAITASYYNTMLLYVSILNLNYRNRVQSERGAASWIVCKGYFTEH